MRTKILIVGLSASTLLACGGDTAAPSDVAGADVAETVAVDVADDRDTDPASNDADGEALDLGPTDGAGTETDTAMPADTTTPLDVAPDAEDVEVADVFVPVPPCPAATVVEGLSVAPPVVLHLSGAGTTGDVARWSWRVVSQPAHSFSPLVGAESAEASYEAAVAGNYVFELDARDAKDEAGCEPARVTVEVIPTATIHVELWWNDNNADPTAEFGADLDLHVMHPDAVGIDVGGSSDPDGWFDPHYDVAWHNPEASWPGPVDAPDDGPIVKLLRRDDSGYGPEVVTIDRPRAGDVYTVGFHIWDDTWSTYLQPTEIRVYIDGVLKNRPNYAVPLDAHVLERVMTIRWPFEGQQSFGFPFATDGDMVPTSPSKE